MKFPANLRSLCRLQITLAALISRPPGVATSPRQLCKDLGSIRSAKEPQITRGRRLLRFQRVSANESSDSDLSWTAITPSKTSRSGSWWGLLRSMLDYGQYPVSRETPFESRGLSGDHRPSIRAGLREPGGKMSGVKRIRF